MSSCSVDGCAKPHQARGYCESHYRKLLKYGDAEYVKPMFVPDRCKADACKRNAECQGYCKAHYARLLRHGDPLQGRTAIGGALNWLESNASHTGDECLIWPFRRRPNGYGEATFRGGRMAANRIMCILAHGEPPTEEHHAAHDCGNGFGGCVNPRHLRWATKSSNEMDKVDHGTSNRGSRHGMSKLTESEVRSIRAAEGSMTQKAIAAQFGISRATVGSIQSRQRWSWLD
ncbi:hypothetical protein 7AX2_9 [uncultured phage]|uniref:HNH nuclease n=2 Tax=uncultured Caudovirales phage TaxID=2100421 RepID=A0A2I2MUH3_9CAUD|nr:hypothetical protein 7AX2_9 [uncultured phage]ASN67420.1 hypothetical protein 2AX2_46 [uncultured Caudovirales phage]ASN68186.1 hypothetical protein 7S5_62 [uncultured Caudovirales phage]ASN71726.1 hypothetical protein 3S7_45 [uncultured Caudovirales phage]